MTGSYLKQLTLDSSPSTSCNFMATSESSHYHTNTSPRSSNCVTHRLQNSTQRTVACNISMCLSTSMSLGCSYSSTTQENNTTRDQHNRGATVFRRQPSCSAISCVHMHVCSPRLHMCPSPSPCPARTVERDPRSIFAPPYPCFLFIFFCLFVTISAAVSCFLRASRVSRLLGLCPCCLRLNGLLVTLFVFISE